MSITGIVGEKRYEALADRGLFPAAVHSRLGTNSGIARAEG